MNEGLRNYCESSYNLVPGAMVGTSREKQYGDAYLGENMRVWGYKWTSSFTYLGRHNGMEIRFIKGCITIQSNDNSVRIQKIVKIDQTWCTVYVTTGRWYGLTYLRQGTSPIREPPRSRVLPLLSNPYKSVVLRYYLGSPGCIRYKKLETYLVQRYPSMLFSL